MYILILGIYFCSLLRPNFIVGEGKKQHQGALPRTISGSWGACLRCGQMGHYVIECTAKILLVKEDNEER